MQNEDIKSKKKIAMVIALQDFRDEEYFIPRSIFVGQGIHVTTASTKKGQAIGSYGGVVNADLVIDDLQVADFDAIVFVGGSGAAQNMDNTEFHRVAQEAIKQGKVLGAICIAPSILAKSGVLKDKKATIWSSNFDKSAIKILQDSGAQYSAEKVVVDSQIVTADGPASARQFAEEIVAVLRK